MTKATGFHGIEKFTWNKLNNTSDTRKNTHMSTVPCKYTSQEMTFKQMLGQKITI